MPPSLFSVVVKQPLRRVGLWADPDSDAGAGAGGGGGGRGWT